MFSPLNNNRLVLPIRNEDNICGSANALLTIVEYGNYQCPTSGEAYWKIKEIQQLLGKNCCLVFRHFPQTDIYINSQKTAEVAEAAAIQGKFWQMHEMLFENQQALNDSDLVEYAVEIGLNVTQFLKDMSERTFFHRVQEDFMSGIRNGVTRTPSCFINGIRDDAEIDIIKLLTLIINACKSG